MSRIGNKKINLLGIKLDENSNNLELKSDKGSLSIPLFSCLEYSVDDNIMLIKRKDDSKDSKSKHGLFRSLVYNAVIGLTKGYTYNLFLQGIGYRVQLKGADLEFNLGYSHPVLFKCPEGVKFTVQGQDKFTVTSNDKQIIGEVCAKIKRLRKRDSYKGKGIFFENEKIVKKQGKSVK